jgi:hypothetical protein
MVTLKKWAGPVGWSGALELSSHGACRQDVDAVIPAMSEWTIAADYPPWPIRYQAFNSHRRANVQGLWLAEADV